MNTLAVIPCHLASRRLPRKNLLPCAGKTLLQRTAEQCQQSKRLTRWLVSTPDQEVVDACTMNGWPVSTLAADLHGKASLGHICLRELWGQPEAFDAVMCLQPTSPLRLPEDIDRAVELLEHPINPFYVPRKYPTAVVGRRSDKHKSTCGTVFLVRSELLPSLPLDGEGVVPLYIPPERAVDVDTPYDFWLAEKLLTLSDSPLYSKVAIDHSRSADVQ